MFIYKPGHCLSDFAKEHLERFTLIKERWNGLSFIKLFEVFRATIVIEFFIGIMTAVRDTFICIIITRAWLVGSNSTYYGVLIFQLKFL